MSPLLHLLRQKDALDFFFIAQHRVLLYIFFERHWNSVDSRLLIVNTENGSNNQINNCMQNVGNGKRTTNLTNKQETQGVHIAHWNNKSASGSVWNEGQTILKSNTNNGIRKCNNTAKRLYISPPYFHSFLTPLNRIWPFILTHFRSLCPIMLVNNGQVVL